MMNFKKNVELKVRMAGRIVGIVVAVAALSARCLAASAPVRLAAGTKIQLKLAEQLKSGDSKVGQTVKYWVAGNVVDGHGHVIVKNGAPAYGTVTKSKNHGHFGRKGKLEFTVEYVRAVDGTHIPLRATQDVNGKSHTAAVVVGMVFLSVFAGFFKGKNVVVKQGTLIPAYVDHDTTVRVWKPNSHQRRR